MMILRCTLCIANDHSEDAALLEGLSRPRQWFLTTQAITCLRCYYQTLVVSQCRRVDHVDEHCIDSNPLPTPSRLCVRSSFHNGFLMKFLLTFISASAQPLPTYSWLLLMYLCTGRHPSSCSALRPLLLISPFFQ